MYSQFYSHTQIFPSISPPSVVPSPHNQAQDWDLAFPMSLEPGSRGQVYLGERDTNLVNCPIYFPSGPFMGRTIRMELHEIQKADLGRKYAKVDRRPLDPPPVVQLKMFEAYRFGADGEWQEKEMEYDDFQVMGLICTVDLFPVPKPELSPAGHTNPDQTSVLSSPSPFSSLYHGEHDYHHLAQQMPDYNLDIPMSSGSVPSSSETINLDPLSEIVHHFDGYPITEQSKKTQALAGATFVQPVVMDYQGRKAIVFVFSDLAVKGLGYFILRYRAFDIFSRPYINSNDSAISAVCYGGIFRIYSTKDFPGLPVSTELTKHLSQWGVQLNIRSTDRRGKKGSKTSKKDKGSPMVTADDDD